MRHAAMLSSLAIAGSLSSRASLWLISCRETATSRWWIACWRWAKASAARASDTTSPTLRAMRQVR